MREIQRQISMCARQHAKFKRMAWFADTEKQRDAYLERADFWLQKQEALVSVWDIKLDG
jgi:hypothetical protein